MRGPPPGHDHPQGPPPSFNGQQQRPIGNQNGHMKNVFNRQQQQPQMNRINHAQQRNQNHQNLRFHPSDGQSVNIKNLQQPKLMKFHSDQKSNKTQSNNSFQAMNRSAQGFFKRARPTINTTNNIAKPVTNKPQSHRNNQQRVINPSSNFGGMKSNYSFSKLPQSINNSQGRNPIQIRGRPTTSGTNAIRGSNYIKFGQRFSNTNSQVSYFNLIC